MYHVFLLYKDHFFKSESTVFNLYNYRNPILLLYQYTQNFQIIIYNRNLIEMGAQIQKPQALNLDQYCPPLQQYKFKHYGPNYCVWNNQLKNQSLIQFPIIIPNQNILRQQIQMYLFRNRHHLLVSSMFFKRNKQTNRGSIFYQRVFTNLSRIKDIPFGDTLQFYYVAFKGFQLLFKKFGYFQIQENMFHITQNKKIKVWCHKDISKLRPDAVNNTMKRSQQQMVKRIIEIISQNSDSSNNCVNIGQIIYEQASFSFSAALHKLREICQREGFIISQKLTCLDIISQGEVGNILDQYGPNKQNVYQNQQQQSKNVQESLKLNLQRFAIRNQSSNIVRQAKQTNYNHTAQISQKIEYAQNSMANTRTKKQKGLQVSHSLQKLKQADSNLNNLNQFSTLNIKNSTNHIQLQSPIKNLQANKFNQLQRYAPIFMHQQQQKIQNVRFVAPANYVQNLQVLNHPPPHLMRNPLCQPPIFNKSHQIIRQNSVDNFKRQQMPKNLGEDQFKVVINVVNRPSTPNNNRNRFPPNIITPVNKTEQPKFLQPFNPFPQPIIYNNQKNLDFMHPNSFHQNQRAQNFQAIRKNQDSNLQFKKQVNYKTNFFQNQNSQFKLFTNGINPRQTFITNLSQFQPKQQNKPFRDTTNFKQRFETYKKNFSYNKFDKKFICENNNSAPNGNNIQNNNNQEIRKQNLKRPFFAEHLYADTVNSYIDSNGFFAQKRSQIEKNIEPTNKIEKSTINQFPTVTDVSDNLSYLPNKQKHSGNDQNIWKQQSIVVKHDINTSNIQMPTSKKYTTNIDQDIWADLQRIKNKYKIPTTQL